MKIELEYTTDELYLLETAAKALKFNCLEEYILQTSLDYAEAVVSQDIVNKLNKEL